MNFIIFCGILLLAGFPAVFVFSAVVLGLATPLVALKDKPFAVQIPFVSLLFLGQAYFWGAWATFSVGLTSRFVSKPEVQFGWLYWLAGFSLCTSLIGWLGAKERAANETAKESPPSAGGLALYWFICAAAFVAFAIWPTVAEFCYGWLLRLFNFTI